jgi:cell division protein FtsI (penicillin-binding protein 3)
MTRVVSDPDGTGKNARIQNVNVAGKTGTSQKFDFARRAYSSERVRTSFMGFFPAENPQVAILVVLDEPQRDKWGGVASAPVFKNIADQILTCFKTHIRENPVYEEDSINRDGKIRQVATGPVIDLRKNEQDQFDESMMPDFRGLTIRQALRRAKERGIVLRIIGNGWAVNQAPAPGVSIDEQRYCTVSFSAGQ